MCLDLVEQIEITPLPGVFLGHFNGTFLGRGAPGRTGNGGADQHQADDPAGMAQGKVHREATAHRATDKNGRVNIKGFEHGFEIVEMIERLIDTYSLAIAAAVIGNGVPAVFRG